MKKVAVITGTTSGLGYYIATYYHNAGYYVVGVNRERFIPEPPIDSNFYFDLSDIIGMKRGIHDLNEHHGKIDVLVNNAGVLYLDDFRSNDLDTIRVDFEAPIYLCKQIIRQEIMIQGHIINIASISGMIGDPDAPIYSACKAGIINLTRSLAKILAPKIRVNCISPGFFNTNLVEGDTPQELIDKVPMQREAQPFEIIPVVDMLQKSPYITGANIVIDGGLSL